MIYIYIYILVLVLVLVLKYESRMRLGVSQKMREKQAAMKVERKKEKWETGGKRGGGRKELKMGQHRKTHTQKKGDNNYCFKKKRINT